MQIVSWSPDVSACGQTTISIGIATLIASKLGYRTFLTSSMNKDDSIDHYIIPSSQRMVHGMVESNIEGVFRRIHVGNIEEEMVKDYCHSILGNGNFDFMKTERLFEIDEKFSLAYGYLLHLANKVYDVTMIDYDGKSHEPLSKAIIEKANQLILCVDGNRYNFMKIKSFLDSHAYLKEKKAISIVINKWNKDLEKTLKQDIKDLKKKYNHIKIIRLPYLGEIVNQCNKGSLIDYLLRHSYSHRKDETTKYMAQLNELVDLLIKSEVRGTHAS